MDKSLYSSHSREISFERMEKSHSKVSPFAFTIKQLKERIIEQENLITSISTLKDEIEKIQF